MKKIKLFSLLLVLTVMNAYSMDNYSIDNDSLKLEIKATTAKSFVNPMAQIIGENPLNTSIEPVLPNLIEITRIKSTTFMIPFGQNLPSNIHINCF